MKFYISLLPTHHTRPYFLFGWPALYCTDTNSGTASQAAPHERRLGGFFVHPVAPYIFFHWNHRARGEGPRPRSQGRFGIAGIRTRTGSDVCSDVANCATPARGSVIICMTSSTLLRLGLRPGPGKEGGNSFARIVFSRLTEDPDFSSEVPQPQISFQCFLSAAPATDARGQFQG